MERLHALPPVVDERTRLLILGSLPSARSLAAGEYYGNPRNQFWTLIGSVLDVPAFAALPYAERLAVLGQRGIGYGTRSRKPIAQAVSMRPCAMSSRPI